MNIYPGDCRLVTNLHRYSMEQGDVGVFAATMLALISPLHFRESHPDLESLRLLATIIKEKGVKPLLEEVRACTTCSNGPECNVHLALAGC